MDPVTVKRTVRALLISAKHGCTPKQLLSDYKRITGECLPYETLGYSTFMQYVKSIPDVVQITSQQGMTVLRGIADESTDHIAKMVARQKTAASSMHKRYSSMLDMSTTGRGPREPKVPHTFQLQLKTLMLSYPNGLAVKHFMEAFARRFGYYLNYRGWGFNSVDQMLKTVPNIVKYQLDPAEKAYMIKRVSAPVVSRAGHTSEMGGVIERARFSRLGESTASKPPLHVNEVLKTCGNSGEGSGGETTGNGGEASGGEPTEKTKTKPKSPPINTKPPLGSLHALDLSSTKTFLAELRSPPVPQKRLPIPKRLIEQVEELLKDNPAGLWVSRFPMEFKEYFEEDLPVSSLGFTSVVHLLSHLPVCEIERPSGTGDWLVFTKGNKTPKVASNHSYLTEAYVSEHLVNSIHWLLHAHPSGIPLSKFSLVFQKFFNRELPVEEIGFASVGEMLRRVPKVKVVKPPDTSLVMVFFMGKEEGNGEEEGEEEGEKSEGGGKDAGDKLIAPAITSGNPHPSSYTKQAPPTNMKMCGVYVTNVKTPSCLCVQLIGESTTKALEYLQEDITQFYNSRAGDAFKIQDPQIGQACCTVFYNDGYWYRAEVTGVPAPDIVEVKYMDYGNVGQVPLGSLRKPKPHYLTLPAQTVDCRLANLKPAGSMWSRRATQLVFEMTRDRPVVAIITSIKGYLMSVCLCDTNTDRDVHINDTLVSQGLAIFSPDSLEDQLSFDNYTLEPVPQGSTGDMVPGVRAPSAPSQVASAPPPTPPLNPQLQTYLQQLLLLQQQQLLLNQFPHNLSSTQTTGLLNQQDKQTQGANFPPSSATQTQGNNFSHSSATQTQGNNLSPTSTTQTQGGNFPSSSATQTQGGNFPPSSATQTQSGNFPPSSATQTQGGNFPPSSATQTQGGNFPPSSATQTQGGNFPPSSATQTQSGNFPPSSATQTQGGNFPPSSAIQTQGGNLSPSSTTQTQGGNFPLNSQIQSKSSEMQSNATTTSGQSSPLVQMPPSPTRPTPPSATGPILSQACPVTELHPQQAEPSPSQKHFSQQSEPPPQQCTRSTVGSVEEDVQHNSPAAASKRHFDERNCRDGGRHQTGHGRTAEWQVAGGWRGRRERNTDRRERNDDRRERNDDRRERNSDRRERNSDRRERNSDRRERNSDRRERNSDRRERNDDWRERNDDGREGFLFVRSVVLTKSHSLHVLRHNDRAFCLSAEISQWFWDSDLLQSMLRQVQKPVWGLLVQERRAPQLFQCLKRTPASRFVRYQREVTVYALDDLPLIVTTFNAPAALCEAVKREVERWQKRGLRYFSSGSIQEDEIEKLGAALKDLQLKRKKVLTSMMERSDAATSLGKAPLEQLLTLEQDISEIRSRLDTLRSGSQGEGSRSQSTESSSQGEGSRGQSAEFSSQGEGSRGQSAESNGQGEGSRGQSAESNGQGEGSRGQSAESNGQGEGGSCKNEDQTEMVFQPKVDSCNTSSPSADTLARGPTPVEAESRDPIPSIEDMFLPPWASPVPSSLSGSSSELSGEERPLPLFGTTMPCIETVSAVLTPSPTQAVSYSVAAMHSLATHPITPASVLPTIPTAQIISTSSRTEDPVFTTLSAKPLAPCTITEDPTSHVLLSASTLTAPPLLHSMSTSQPTYANIACTQSTITSSSNPAFPALTTSLDPLSVHPFTTMYNAASLHSGPPQSPLTHPPFTPGSSSGVQVPNGYPFTSPASHNFSPRVTKQPLFSGLQQPSVSTIPKSPQRPIGLGRGLRRQAWRQATIGLGRGGLPNTGSAVGDWQYVAHSRKSGRLSCEEFPPLGSGAGLDII